VEGKMKRVEILNQRVVFDDVFKIEEVTLRFEWWKLPGIELSAYKALRKNARSNDTFSRRSVYQIGCKSKIVYQDALINYRSWPILMSNSKDFCDDLP
jgi:hypothetical protein